MLDVNDYFEFVSPVVDHRRLLAFELISASTGDYSVYYRCFITSAPRWSGHRCHAVKRRLYCCKLLSICRSDVV